MISITGASGGIGGALLEALLKRFPTAEIAASYNHGDISIKHPRVSWQSLYLRDEKQVKTWANAFKRVDWLLNCAGFLQGDIGSPEKSIRAVDVNFLFEPSYTAAMFVSLLTWLDPAQSGKFWAWDGTNIAW